MQYTPDAIVTADLAIARKHMIGAEKRLLAHDGALLDMGSVLLTGDGSGIWTPDGINLTGENSTDLATAGDLVAVVKNELRADAACVLTLNVTFNDDSTGTASVTFTPPSWGLNKKFYFQHGVAKDLRPVGAGNSAKLISKITGLASVTNAQRGSEILIAQLPATLSDWQEIGFVENVRPRVASRPAVSIPDRHEGTAEVVPGRSEESRLEINTRYRGVVDGLWRYSSRNCCFMLEVRKQGIVLTERHVFANSVIQVNPDFGDGNDIVRNAGEGAMGRYLGFYAP